MKNYILITMNCYNRRLLLPLEDNGLTVDNIILWIYGLKMELMACAELVVGQQSKAVNFMTLHVSINDMKYF